MIYLIRMKGTSYVKIGIAANPKKRLASLASGNPMPLELIFSIQTEDGMCSMVYDEQAEAEIHTELEAYRVRGEWFILTDTQVASIIYELTERFKKRVIWNRSLRPYPPPGYMEGQERYNQQPLLSHCDISGITN